MSTDRDRELTPAIQGAVDELQGLIRGRYPLADFAISSGEDDPEAVHLNTTVDVEDPDEVMDLVIDKVLELQIEQGLPVHVIPLRPLHRVLDEMHAQASSRTRHRHQTLLDDVAPRSRSR